MQKAKHKNGRHRSPKRHAYLTICLMHAVASFLVRGGEMRLSTCVCFQATDDETTTATILYSLRFLRANYVHSDVK